jgi:hypothetical protein
MRGVAPFLRRGPGLDPGGDARSLWAEGQQRAQVGGVARQGPALVGAGADGGDERGEVDLFAAVFLAGLPDVGGSA